MAFPRVAAGGPKEPTVGTHVGYTPLLKADRLAKWLGVREAWVKNDAVNYPTLSFKDRVVSVALSRSKELGFKTGACASTGNLANSVAANAASAGMDAIVFIPADLEEGKILNSLIYGVRVVGIRGHYDEVNRLCPEIAGKYNWAFVNVNMRPYYAEGSKSMAYEITEQLGWSLPQHTVVPMAQARSPQDSQGLPGVDQAWPCQGHKALCTALRRAVALPFGRYKQGMDFFKPVKPDTIAKSLPIGRRRRILCAQGDEGNRWCVRRRTETKSARRCRHSPSARDFTETAGGVTVGVAKKLVASGKIPAEDSVVLASPARPQNARCRQRHVGSRRDKPSLREFEQL
ncbi:MAG: threonine synthase [Verrucomicrobiota bacterium]|nr:MAG: threonine synthase [Verrucomicrobiota bacterium]